MRAKVLTALLLTVFAMSSASGNGLRLENLRVLGGGRLSLAVSWQNCWNWDSLSTGNHDAVWLFAKYRKAGQSRWQHLQVSTQPGAQSSTRPELLSAQAAQDGRGWWLRTQTTTDTAIEAVPLELTPNWPQGTIAEIRFFGIEMVYIPAGPFSLGDGLSNNSLAGPKGQPLRIISEAALPPDSLQSIGKGAPGDTLPNQYPKGFMGFYCMKYELSQAQYAGFLNTLSPEQQARRSQADPQSAAGTLALSGANPRRNAVVIAQPAQGNQSARYATDANSQNPPDSSGDAQDRACNWLGYADLLAYLDWAALRPMSELEFEKACRGPLGPQAGEYAWGTPKSRNADTPQNDGYPGETSTEQGTPQAGLANHGTTIFEQNLFGPLRCGFAAQQASGRVPTGAAYYGPMELSGNLWEVCIRAYGQGLGFRAENGDGQLSTAGEANSSSWPAAEGAIVRGGAWNSWVKNDPSFEYRDLSTSDRFYWDLAPDNRRDTQGGRGVRSFPQ